MAAPFICNRLIFLLPTIQVALVELISAQRCGERPQRQDCCACEKIPFIFSVNHFFPSGILRYNPTMSRTLSTKNGSLESLKLLVRYGSERDRTSNSSCTHSGAEASTCRFGRPVSIMSLPNHEDTLWITDQMESDLWEATPGSRLGNPARRRFP